MVYFHNVDTVQICKKTTILPEFSTSTLGIIIRDRETEREERFIKGEMRQLGIGERGQRIRDSGQ